MESKRKRRYFRSLANNGAHAWTPYGAESLRYALECGSVEVHFIQTRLAASFSHTWRQETQQAASLH